MHPRVAASVIGTVVVLFAGAVPAGAQRSGPATGPPIRVPSSFPIPEPQLWVSGYFSDQVHRYTEDDGTYLNSLASVRGAQSIRYGPDGLLYICAEKVNKVLRFRRGKRLGAFVADDPGTPEDETGGLAGPTAAVFGPDGDLYVASFDSDRVLRYDGATGAFVEVFVKVGSGGLDGPDAGMVFGPDGDLYVPSFNSDQVLLYDGQSGAFIKVFAGPGKGLRNPRMIRFLANGDVLVSSWGSDDIRRFDSDGKFQSVFLTMNRPTGFAFGPDGDVYVTSDQSDRVVRFNANGTRIGTLVPSGTGGLQGATYVEFIPPW